MMYFRKIIIFLAFMGISAGVFAKEKKNIEKIHYKNGIPGPEDVQKYYDYYFTKYLNLFDIPGGIISVVEGDKVLFSKGYGYSNIIKVKEFKSGQTVLTLASVSNLVTAVAILQLYEEGKIDLDEDVSRYVKSVKISDDFGKLTVRSLLFHSGGFESGIVGGFSKDPDHITPLSEELSLYITRRIYKGGLAVTYGNIAPAILGVLIEDVTGMSFAEYTEKKIFLPLKMDDTTFEQILPAKMFAETAVGYSLPNPNHNPYPYLYINLLSTGGMRSTAADMNRFMVSLLKTAQGKGQGILKPRTVLFMFNENFRMNPEIPGTTPGFFEMEIAGERVIYCDGDGLGFYSRVFFIPSKNVGVFFFANSDGGKKMREKLSVDFVQRYFYKEREKAEKDYPGDFQKYEGVYRPVQADESTFFKITLLFSNYLEVQSKNGRLYIQPAPMGEGYGTFTDNSQWVPGSEGGFNRLYGNEITHEKIRFQPLENEGLHMITSRGYHGAYRKLPLSESPDFHIGLVIFCMIVFHFSFFIWPIAGWFFRKRDLDAPILPLATRAAAFSLSAIYPILFVLLFVVLKDIQEVLFGVPLGFRMLGLGFLVGLLLTIYYLFRVYTTWKESHGTIFDRFFLSILALSALSFNWFLFYWNLLGAVFA